MAPLPSACMTLLISHSHGPQAFSKKPYLSHIPTICDLSLMISVKYNSLDLLINSFQGAISTIWFTIHLTVRGRVLRDSLLFAVFCRGTLTELLYVTIIVVIIMCCALMTT